MNAGKILTSLRNARLYCKMKIGRIVDARKISQAKNGLPEFKYSHNLQSDVVELSKNSTESPVVKNLLEELHRRCNMRVLEQDKECIRNYAKGIKKTESDHYYFRYKTLENFSKENPDSFVFFSSLGHNEPSAFQLECLISNYPESLMTIAKDTPLNEIKQTCKEIETFWKTVSSGEKELCREDYMNLLIMKKYNPKMYQYLTTTNDIKIIDQLNSWGNFQRIPTETFLKNITPEQLQVMTNNGLSNVHWLGDYVEFSDSFVKPSEFSKMLSEDLAKHKLSTDVQLYRGEKTVGMFDTIGIDKDFEKQVRKLLNKNKRKAKKLNIVEYSGLYSDMDCKNLYDLMNSKTVLTLADAMEIARFGDKKYIEELTKRIKDAKVIDTRFKSLSFDRGMAEGWASHPEAKNTTMIQNATVKKGTQGGFDNFSINSQYEVILNNTPKEITTQNVVYDKETDTFLLDTIIQNV